VVTRAHSAIRSGLRILAVTQGQWGERIADHVGHFHPDSWTVQRWSAPPALPLLIDDPADFLPANVPKADLILALGETPAVAQLIPDLAKQSGAQSVIAPIDRNESLPPGLVTQLRGWLAELGVAVVFPKPFCSLTETAYNQPPIRAAYDDPVIREFARVFGKPRFLASIDPEMRISLMFVERDSACGCARHVARGLLACPVREAEYQAGMLHHHYPCLAGMTQDQEYRDTLMHVSGHILREAVRKEIADYLEPVPYLQPPGRVQPEAGKETSDGNTQH
jgi:hypothetical protein